MTTTTTTNKRGILATALRVLALSERSMTPKQMVRVARCLGWWTPPNNGQTPEATLGAAIYLEIKRDGALARFVKVGKGMFRLR
jgi:hypothetical protein